MNLKSTIPFGFLFIFLTGLLSAEDLVTVTTPILLGTDGTKVQKIDLQPLDGMESASVNVTVRLKNTAILESAAIEIGGNRYRLEPLADGEIHAAFQHRFNRRQELALVLRPRDSAKLDSRVQGGIVGIETGGRKVAFENPGEWPVARLLVAPGSKGVHTYRIPGIATGLKGTLLAVYDLRHDDSHDLPANIDIGLSRSLDGGETWEEHRTIMNFGDGDPKEGVGDPAILVDAKSGRIWVAALWAHAGHSIATSKPGLEFGRSGQFVLSHSDDDGKTWSSPRNITSEVASDQNWRILFNGPGNGITLRDGSLVFAAQYWDAGNLPWATIVFSRDGGRTWAVGTGARSDTTEAQVVELTDGSIMLNMRDNRGGSRSVAVTKDFGKSWTEHPSSRKALPDPVCQASLLRLEWKSGKDGKGLLAFMNPNTVENRYNMTLQTSEDDGMSWTRKRRVYDPPCFGYSSITLIDSEHIGALYETRGGLIFQKIKIADIK